MKKQGKLITQIERDSIGEEMALEAGDELLQINGKTIMDIFDYRYLIKDEFIEVLIRKKQGEEWLLEIEKEEDEDLGIVFADGLMDGAKSCKNKCIFCFVDQLPKGMRQSLYFKDDDSRLSFLQGNYITLTNMDERDIDRIIFYHLSPVNISVHTTDPTLRVEMLKNPNAAHLMGHLQKIYDAGILMNFQIVLCKGVNDGAILDKTILDLARFLPGGKSLSVVPVGITRYREHLYPLENFTREEAIELIHQINAHQQRLKQQYGTNFVYAADEFYIKAKQDFPHVGHYEDFPQIENGVGMAASFIAEFEDGLERIDQMEGKREISLITGKASSYFINSLIQKAMKKFQGLQVHLYIVENHFFGEHITVSGLLTGKDILNTLKGKNLGDCLLIPQNALKQDEDIFLDDVTLNDLRKALQIKVQAVKSDGSQFLFALVKGQEDHKNE